MIHETLRQSRRLPRRARDRKREPGIAAAVDAPIPVEFENPLATPQPLHGFCGYRAEPEVRPPSSCCMAAPGSGGGWTRVGVQRLRVLGLCHAHHRSLWPARNPVGLHRRRACAIAPDAYRALKFLAAPALRRSRSRRRDRLLAWRLACADLGRARRHRTQSRPSDSGQRSRFYPPCLRFQGRHDRADPHHDRRARRLHHGDWSAATWPMAATTAVFRARKARRSRSS